MKHCRWAVREVSQSLILRAIIERRRLYIIMEIRVSTSGPRANGDKPRRPSIYFEAVKKNKNRTLFTPSPLVHTAPIYLYAATIFDASTRNPRRLRSATRRATVFPGHLFRLQPTHTMRPKIANTTHPHTHTHIHTHTHTNSPRLWACACAHRQWAGNERNRQNTLRAHDESVCEVRE